MCSMEKQGYSILFSMMNMYDYCIHFLFYLSNIFLPCRRTLPIHPLIVGCLILEARSVAIRGCGNVCGHSVKSEIRQAIGHWLVMLV